MTQKFLKKEKKLEPLLLNSDFSQWSKGSPIVSYDDDVTDVDHWRIKTRDGKVNAICSKVEDGMAIKAIYKGLGYLYIRQIIPNVMRFSEKFGVLDIDITTTKFTTYDVYITARYSEDNTNRTLVIDTKDIIIPKGRHNISIPFTVPKLDDTQPLTDINGLSVAFRLIGKDETIEVTIHSIKMRLT